MALRTITLTFCVLAAGTAIAQSSPAPTPVLVELFTSEGCSSCPPADALLRQLQGMHTSEGQMIVALSEHVTYWNRLGWADPFSQELFTDRQNAYGERFALDSVYTPQIVVQGSRQVLGSDRYAVLKAVAEQHASGSLAVHLASVASAGGTVSFTYSVSGESPGHSAELFAVVAEDMVTSNVLRGENSGRKLSHVAVARSLTRVAKVGDGPAGVRSAQIGILAKPGEHLLLFVQEKDYGRVLSLDSREIPVEGGVMKGISTIVSPPDVH